MTPSAQLVAVAQMRTTPQVDDNLAAVHRLTARAAARGAATVLFPEAFSYLGPDAGKQEILEPHSQLMPFLVGCVAGNP